MSFPERYERAINQIVALSPGPDKFAHVMAGLAIWLITAMILRKPLHSRWPLAMVVGLELANEYVDYLAAERWTLGDALGDMAATWFWPFALAFCLSSMPRLRAGR